MKTEEDPARRDGRKWVLCPKCRAFAWRIGLNILDTRNGKTVSIYRCDCGPHIIWDDYPHLA
jgi:hypothetical protein